MKSKFLRKEIFNFNPETQSFLFTEDVGAVDEIAEKLAKRIKRKGYILGGEKYPYYYKWSKSRKAKVLQTQITMFLPTLNDLLEEYFSIRNTSLGTALNTLNFMFCFTKDYHYERPFGRNFIQLLDDHDERLNFGATDVENRIINQDLERFQELYNNFHIETVTKGGPSLDVFWTELLRVYITDVISAVKSHDVFKILGNITDTEVKLGQNDIDTVEDCFTFDRYFDREGNLEEIDKFPEEDRLPGNFSDSYMAVSNRNHLLSPDNPEHVDEINRIIEDCKISEETLEKFNFHHEPASADPSTMSLSDDDMESTIDPDDQEEILAENTQWRDAITPCSSYVARAASSSGHRER